MLILITVFSILAFTAVIYILNKIFKIRICPVCGGVSLTWILLVLAKYLGYEIDALIPAILMGGTVVGIAYSSEKFLLNGSYSLLWKTFFIPAGFIAVYSFFAFPARFFLVSLFPVLTIVLFFFAPNIIYSKKNEISKNKSRIFPQGAKSEAKPQDNRKARDKKDIQEKLKNCC